jgi:hypothetical protein
MAEEPSSTNLSAIRRLILWKK